MESNTSFTGGTLVLVNDMTEPLSEATKPASMSVHTKQAEGQTLKLSISPHHRWQVSHFGEV